MASEVESMPPTGDAFAFNPQNFRAMIQRQIDRTVDSNIDRYVGLSIGDIDGRFLSTYPATQQRIEDTKGRRYFIMGVSRAGDGSVAAP